MANLPLRIITFLSVLFIIGLTACSNDKPEGNGSAFDSGKYPSNETLLPRIQSFPDSTLTLAESLLDSAREVFKEEENHFALGEVYGKQSRLAMMQEKAVLSADLKLLASEAYQAADSLQQAILSAGMAGMKFVRLKDYPKSTEVLQYRLDLATLMNDSSHIGWSLNGLSLPYQYSHNMVQAKAYLIRAQEINKTLKDKRLEAAITLNLGNVFKHQKEFDPAIVSYQESYRISSEIGDENIKWVSLYNITGIYLERSEYTAIIEALSGWDKGRFDNIADSNKPYIHYSLARAFLGMGDISMATYHVQQSCDLSVTVSNERSKIYCFELTALLAEEKGDLEVALANLKKYHRLLEESTGEETDKQLQTIKESYDVKIRDQEITELKDQEILRQQKAKYQRSVIIGFTILSILTIMGIIFSIRSSFKSRIAHQQKEIAEAQLHFLQARMSPHFVFNALNGIQNQVLQADPFSAYEYIGKFSGLLRVITDTTTKPEILLADEIALLQNYLDLEQLRFRDGFSYTVEAEEELSSLNPKIPAMMIQPVLENAIIHGLSESGIKGIITVALSLQRDTVCCVVTDNGIGREASAQISHEEKEQHLSISTENLKKRFKALERLGYPMKPFTTTDLFDDEKASGTQVTLYLPIINTGI